MRTTSIIPTIGLGAALTVLGGCAQLGGTADNDEATDSESTAAAEQETEQAEKKAVDVAIAAIPDSSPMSKLRAGMTESQVREIMGREDTRTSYQTGKRWIPKFGRFANDTRRHSLFFNNQGFVVMSYNRYTGQYKLIEVGYEPEAIYD